MGIIRISRNSNCSWSDILLIILLVYNSGYAAANATSATTIWLTLAIAISICAVKLYTRGELGKTFCKPRLSRLLLALPAIFVLLSGVLNLNLYTSIRPILVIFCAYLVVQTYTYDEIIKGFQAAIVIVCIVNVGVYIADTVGIVIPTTKLITNNGSIYQNGILFFKLFYGDILAERYMGCFWEPGLYASFILLGIATMKLKPISWRSALKLALYIFCIYTTKSAAGYVIFPLAIMYALLKEEHEHRMITMLINAVLIGCIIIAFIHMDDIINALYFINPSVFGKLINANVASNYARVNSYEINLKMFLERPLFGYGIGQADLRYSELTNSSQTSTSTYWLAVCGFWGILPTVLLIRGVMGNNQTSSFLAKMALLIMILMILNKEPHINNVATTIIVFLLKCIVASKQEKEQIKGFR